MKKLLNIPDEIVEPLLLLAAKEHKGNLHACIVETLREKVNPPSAYIVVSELDRPVGTHSGKSFLK